MMHEIVKQIDREKYDFSIFALTPPKTVDPFEVPPYRIIDGVKGGYAGDNLVSLCESVPLDVLIFVGLDIWAFAKHLPKILEIKRRTRMSLISIFPWDTVKFREDWARMVEVFDFPLVYSMFGYEQLKERVAHVKYFRPPLFEKEKFRKFTEAERKAARKQFFPTVPEDKFLLGYMGNNQFRKDPLRLIRAFFDAKEKIPNMCLYLHTELTGRMNIRQYVRDCGAQKGDIYTCDPHPYSTEDITSIYNCFDAYILPSLQEGLSWTIVEAMLCGTPIIASNSTAHKELLEGGAGLPVAMTDFCPLISETESGKSHIESWACNLKDLTNKIVSVATCPDLRKELSENGLKRGKEWIEGIDDVNKVLESAVKAKNTFKLRNRLKRVLFMQHSSAGDVLMTTRCLKGLKERYGGLPIDYMTSPQYMDILVNNPLIEHVLPWSDKVPAQYQYVVNPHGERILPGHWGRNSNSLLADFYWKILKVEPTDVMIEKKRISNEVIAKIVDEAPFVVVHTTGGDPVFRTYKYMADVCPKIRDAGMMTIQLGGKDDYPAGADLDLRGVLSFRETAWVMSEAAYAITVDSFISHLAGFLGIPQVCLFGSGNHNVVKPVGYVVCMTPDYVNYCKGLGPCSGSVKDCPIKCTGIHDPEDVFKNLQSLFPEGEICATEFSTD